MKGWKKNGQKITPKLQVIKERWGSKYDGVRIKDKMDDRDEDISTSSDKW